MPMRVSAVTCNCVELVLYIRRFPIRTNDNNSAFLELVIREFLFSVTGT